MLVYIYTIRSAANGEANNVIFIDNYDKKFRKYETFDKLNKHILMSCISSTRFSVTTVTAQFTEFYLSK